MSVYFVQAGIGGRIKIGFSPYPERRVKEISRYCGPDLIQLAVIEGPRSFEGALHRLLKAHRAHDEWFDPTPEVLDVARRAASLPQCTGSRKQFSMTEYSMEELAQYSKLGGGIGAAAKEALKFPYCLTFSILAGMIALFGTPTIKGEPYERRPRSRSQASARTSSLKIRNQMEKR